MSITQHIYKTEFVVHRRMRDASSVGCQSNLVCKLCQLTRLETTTTTTHAVRWLRKSNQHCWTYNTCICVHEIQTPTHLYWHIHSQKKHYRRASAQHSKCRTESRRRLNLVRIEEARTANPHAIPPSTRCPPHPASLNYIISWSWQGVYPRHTHTNPRRLKIVFPTENSPAGRLDARAASSRPYCLPTTTKQTKPPPNCCRSSLYKYNVFSRVACGVVA